MTIDDDIDSGSVISKMTSSYTIGEWMTVISPSFLFDKNNIFDTIYEW